MTYSADSSYSQAMQVRIDAFSDIPIMRQVLSDQVTAIAEERLRNVQGLADPQQVETDFAAAMQRFRLEEDRIFHIMAPPALTPASLQNGQIPETPNLGSTIVLQSVRSASEILLLARAFRAKDTLRGIMPLTLERLVMHNVTRRFILDFSPQDDVSKELQKIVRPLSCRILRECLNSAQTLRNEIESQALHYLQTGNSEGIDSQLLASIDELMGQVTAEPTDLSMDELQEAVSKRAADLKLEAYVKTVVDHYDMASAPELAGYKRLPPQSSETRRFIMINGGVASGKTTAQQQEAARMRESGVEWEDLCRMNRDAFKPMLLQGEVDQQRSGFLTYIPEDEAYLLRDAILHEYKHRLATDTAPHLYVDQVSPTIEMMRLAAQPGGQGLDLTVVYAPVEAAFLMARKRELATGYIQATNGLLDSHSSVGPQLLRSLKTARTEGCANIRLRIVANIAQGVITPVAEIDLAKRTSVIQDSDRLLSFFHKTHINRQAERFEELYPPASQNPGPCCLQQIEELVENAQGGQF